MDSENIKTEKAITYLHLETVSEIRANYKPPSYLVDGMIYQSTFNIICGQPKVGKSLLAMSLADKLSYGGKFLGKFKCQKSNVLYIDEDNGSGTVRQRVDSMGLGLKNEDGLQISLSKGFKIDRKGGMTELKQAIKKKNINVVVLDSFIRIHSKEENLSSEMREITRLFRELTEMGITVIVVHHSGKPNEQKGANHSRGSSEIIAGADNVFTVQKKKDKITLESNAMRDSDKHFKIGIKLVENGQGILEFITQDSKSKLEQRNEELEKNITGALKNSFIPMSIRDVSVKVGENEKKIRNLLARLVDSGKVEVDKKRGPHNTAYYKLA